jgi:outer membrane protein assembly factor BamB
VYLGTNSGDFYALDESTGQTVWTRFFGYVAKLTCSARGFASTAAVAVDPVTGRTQLFVYTPSGTLEALNPSDGSTIWSTAVTQPSATQNDYYAWSSPTIANGRVYVGVASQCDTPLVQGGLRSYSESTGQLLARYDAVPAGSVGGSIWSSPAVSSDGRSVFITTGNPPGTRPNEPGDTSSIVRLDALTLARLDKWTIPSADLALDDDFGASPTVFTARLAAHGKKQRLTTLVGACNKNGTFYAFKASALAHGPVWTVPLGATGSCLAAAVWNGSSLYLSGPAATINGVVYGGSIRCVDPANGHTRWIIGLPNNILGTPSIDGAGVIAVATDRLGADGSDSTYLIDASSGTLLTAISSSGSQEFPQPIFSDGLLLLATQTAGLHAYRP